MARADSFSSHLHSPPLGDAAALRRHAAAREGEQASEQRLVLALPSLVVDSLRGVSNDDASRKRDGDLRLDFTDDSIAAKRYRAAMCALFVAARASDAAAVAERLAALRLLDAAPPSSSTDVARGDPILLYRSPRSLDPYEDDAIVVRSDGGVFLR